MPVRSSVAKDMASPVSEGRVFGSSPPCVPRTFLSTVPASMGELRAEPYTSYEPRVTEEPGRVCADPDCKTILNIYNKTDRCTLHPHHKLPLHRNRKKG